MNSLPRRRQILKGLAALSAAAWATPAISTSRGLRVGVVGGGIVGASIAMHLAEAGAAVTLFEKTGPALGTTQNSFAWVNAFTDDAHYRSLRIQSLLAYRDLDRSLSLGMVWGGYLDWAGNEAQVATVRAAVDQQADSP